MAEHAPKQATFDDLLDVPDHLVAEIIAGTLYTQPRPAPRHASATSVLVSDLNGPYQRGRGGPGGWWILYEPELHLDADALVPDLAGWLAGVASACLGCPTPPGSGWLQTGCARC